ncbi:glyoxalase family protein [Bacillus sp. JCM 19045]|nr:glyoxalase family protein [Bacillus sp. JCM 19045]
MELNGIHHVSSIIANAKVNLAFYRNILGLNLVKKTVNQDSPDLYHLFYGDQQGSPGTELTFFEIPTSVEKVAGTNRISTISLVVPSDEALRFWQERFTRFQVNHQDIEVIDGKRALPFQDPEGHELSLISASNNERTGIETREIPAEHAIIGLGPATLTVRYLEASALVLTDVLGFTKVNSYQKSGSEYTVFETANAGLDGQVHLTQNKQLPLAKEGKGSVHHLAFRVTDAEELKKWVELLEKEGFQTSGFVDRYYFQSLYFREPNGILYELATDGPGFAIDENSDKLGKKLSLPPFLEQQRKEIEARLKPLRT